LRINQTKKINISDHPSVKCKKNRRNTSSSHPVREQKMKLPSGPSFAVAILSFGTKGEGRVKERVGWQRDTHGNLNCIRAWRERKTHIARVIVQIPFSIFRAFILLIFLMRPHVFRFPWAPHPPPNFHPLSVTRAYAFTIFYYSAHFYFYFFPPSLTPRHLIGRVSLSRLWRKHAREKKKKIYIYGYYKSRRFFPERGIATSERRF